MLEALLEQVSPVPTPAAALRGRKLSPGQWQAHEACWRTFLWRAPTGRVRRLSPKTGTTLGRVMRALGVWELNATVWALPPSRAPGRPRRPPDPVAIEAARADFKALLATTNGTPGGLRHVRALQRRIG